MPNTQIAKLSPREFFSRLFALVICIFDFATMQIASAAPPKSQTNTSQKIEAIQLDQIGAFVGNVKTYIAEKGIRVELDNDCYFVSLAPHWRVVLINPRTGKAVDFTFQQYLTRSSQYTYMPNQLVYDPSKWNVLKVGKVTYAGEEVSKFIIPVSATVRHATATTPCSAYFLVLEKPVPKELTQVLAKLFVQSHAPGIPLHEVWEPNKKKNVKRQVARSSLDLNGDFPFLETKKIKQVRLDQSLFQYPAKFTKVAKEADVVQNTARTESFEDLARDMKVGE